MQLQINPYRIVLIVACVMGIISVMYADYIDNSINTEMQYNFGLKDGFDKGFVSGMQYGTGQIYSQYNLTIPNNTTWYFNAGYNNPNIPYNNYNLNLNPFYLKER